MIQRPVSPHVPKPVSRRAFAIGFTLFLFTLGGMFWGMMRVVAPKLANLQADKPAFYELTEVLSGDTLLVTPNLGKKLRKETAPIPVKVVGIEAPPLEPGPAADAYAAAVGCPVEDVPALGRTSRNAIKGWIYRQSNLMLEYDHANPVYDGQGRLLAHAEVGHVDIGRIQLREGQARVSAEPHGLRDPYQKTEDGARAERAGIWRWQKH
jgi:endonuclease YncB( thermonuclease family)